MRRGCLIFLSILGSAGSFGLLACSGGSQDPRNGGAGGHAGSSGGQAGATAGAAGSIIPSGTGGALGAAGAGGAAGQPSGGGGTTNSGGAGHAAGGTMGGAGTGGSGGATGVGGAAGQPVDTTSPGLRLLAGGLGGPGNIDGMGAAARFVYPGGMASDGAGNFYVSDSGSIRKIVIATGAVTTLALAADQATFSGASGIVGDGVGNLYFTGGTTVGKIVIATGAVTTLAGVAGQPGSTDGTGAAARFFAASAIVGDGAGNLFVVEVNGDDITSHIFLRKVVIATGAVTTLADWEENTPYPTPSIASDGAGNLYLTDNDAIRKISIATGAATTLAGSTGQPGSADGTGAAASFGGPNGITSDGAGNLYVVDSSNATIRKVVMATGAVTTIAGMAGHGQSGNVDGVGAAARFNWPYLIASDGAGNLCVSDFYNDSIRKIVVATGAVTTLAGAAPQPGSVDATGAAARFRNPGGTATDGAGNLYVADGNTIRKIVIATGAVTTLAGTAGQYGSMDGTGAAASFSWPLSVAWDGTGNLYVGDGIIRKIAVATGVVTTLTNGPGNDTSELGGGAVGLVSDGAGNLYFADAFTTIWKVATATGDLTRVAGTAGQLGSADGTGAAASFSGPSGIASDGAGNLYVADTNNGTIRKVVLATRVVTTLAGVAGQLGSADGIGAAASFNAPYDIASDGAGNLYVADGNTIRKIVIATGAVSTVIGAPGKIGVSLGPLPASLSSARNVVVLPTGELAIVDYTENAVLIGRL
jgi:hypothetical protein